MIEMCSCSMALDLFMPVPKARAQLSDLDARRLQDETENRLRQTKYLQGELLFAVCFATDAAQLFLQLLSFCLVAPTVLPEVSVCEAVVLVNAVVEVAARVVVAAA